MKRCPLTYKPLGEDETNYSREGLNKLARGLKKLDVFQYSRQAQVQEAQRLATKLSIQGVQPKISARLNVGAGRFEIVDRGGTFIIKPQIDLPFVPENEDLTMHLAKACGIEVPWHGLILCSDGTYSYVIKRFDRLAKSEKVPLEDFSQLLGAGRDTKYDVPMERCLDVLEHCTFSTLEAAKLLRRIVFSFLIGNEDLHLKNLSLITKGNKVALSPAYDLLNSTIVTPGTQEEMALELNGKKRGFTREDFVENFALKNDILNAKVTNQIIDDVIANLEKNDSLIEGSFLDEEQKRKYKTLLAERIRRIS